MRQRIALTALFISVFAAGMLPASTAAPQRRHPPSARHAVARPPARAAVVFVGGYFYDPFFGPYPWWPRPAYPYAYYPRYADRAVLRILATPAAAAVYVDGFYAGIVEDFNGYFQGLPLPPGGHDVVLYFGGYRTVERRLYLAPGSTLKFHETMERLPEGEVSQPPATAPPLPLPPAGSYIPPRTAPLTPAPSVRAAHPASAPMGTLALRAQPATATVLIDGEPWVSSDGGRFEIQLPCGPHRIQVSSAGFHEFVTDIEVVEEEVVTLNVSLLRQREPID